MAKPRIETDYLIVGAGAGGMAFVDTLIADSQYTAVIVDKHHAPGGHWQDAYPFVQLHQPSAYYGVNSLQLGSETLETVGPNAGFYDVAGAPEICAHFARALHALLETGRVQFQPLARYEPGPEGAHHIVSQITGERLEVVVRRKLVDATYLENSIPATHTPRFEVESGVRCVPINELARLQAPSWRYVVLGAGKTAMDACLWLLDNGTPAERVRWVKPREAYVIDRARMQPLAHVETMFDAVVRQSEAGAAAESLQDLFERLEAAGLLLRVDPSVPATMYRCATVSQRELAQLRKIVDVVRLGRVVRLQREQLVLEHGSVSAQADDLYIDCTAVGLRTNPVRPIFEPDRVTLQPLRTCQPCFNSALIGHIEATRDDLTEKNRLCRPNPYPSEPADWARMFVASAVAQGLWTRDPELSTWIDASRLNATRALQARRDDPAVRALLVRFKLAIGPAIENLSRLLPTRLTSTQT